MKKQICLIFYYSKPNKYSFNTLLGALDSVEDFRDFPVEISKNSIELTQMISNKLVFFNSVIVGFSYFSSQLNEIQEIITEIRAKFGSRVILMAGGPCASAEPAEALRTGFDIVVSGEGEETLMELLRKIQKIQSFEGIKGISYVNLVGRQCHNERRMPVDLDSYLPFSIQRHKIGPIEITRGCPFACSFCQTSFLFGAKPRHRSLEKIKEAVVLLKEKGIKDFRFLTPNALSYGSVDGRTVSLEKVEQLLFETRLIIQKERKIYFGSFPSEIRPEQLSDDAMTLLEKYADNDTLVIGAQSGSQKILDLCHRGHTVENVYNAALKISRTKFKPVVDFIFGLPFETEEDSLKTLQLIDELNKIGAFIRGHFFEPLPGTPWKNEKPTQLSARVISELEKKIGRGEIYGDWKKMKSNVE